VVQLLVTSSPRSSNPAAPLPCQAELSRPGLSRAALGRGRPLGPLWTRDSGRCSTPVSFQPVVTSAPTPPRCLHHPTQPRALLPGHAPLMLAAVACVIHVLELYPRRCTRALSTALHRLADHDLKHFGSTLLPNRPNLVGRHARLRGPQDLGEGPVSHILQEIAYPRAEHYMYDCRCYGIGVQLHWIKWELYTAVQRASNLSMYHVGTRHQQRSNLSCKRQPYQVEERIITAAENDSAPTFHLRLKF
jgi:hypothetical protein